MPTSQQPSPFQCRTNELGGPGVGNVLIAVGEAVRKSAQQGARFPEAERALSALSLADVRSCLESVSVASVVRALCDAAEASFESVFAEEEAQVSPLRERARVGVFARDAVASQLAAGALRLAQQRRMPGADVAACEALAKVIERLETELGQADRAERSRVSRKLTGINDVRRGELDRLGPQARESAWWYADLVEDDMLLPSLGSLEQPLDFSPRDTRSDRPADLLRRVALGIATDAERGELASLRNESWALARGLAEDVGIEQAAVLEDAG